MIVKKSPSLGHEKDKRLTIPTVIYYGTGSHEPLAFVDLGATRKSLENALWKHIL